MSVDFSWREVLEPLVSGQDLTREAARQAMEEVMQGRASPSQIAALVTGLRAKGETVEEMAGLVEAMRAAAVSVEVGGGTVDTAGTGGDGIGTFNISTAAALIAAGAGARVAKHGNRAASSRTGSADVLEALGVAIDLEPQATARLVVEHGFGFFFAPRYHPAMRHAAPVRRELGVPTVFNFLGPLCNPAGVQRQVIGVSDPKMAERMIGVLAAMGAEHAFVFHGDDGLDELSVSGPSTLYRLLDGEVSRAEVTPEEVGLARWPLDELRGGDAAENAAIVRSVLDGEQGPRRDVCLFNAGAAIVVAGLAEGLIDGVQRAANSIDSGAAAAVLRRVVDLSGTLRA